MPLNGYLVYPFQNFSTQLRSSEHDFEGCTAKIGLIVWIVTFSFNNKSVDLFILSHLLMSTEKKNDLKTFLEFLLMHSSIFRRILLRILLCQRARVILKNMPLNANWYTNY